MADEREVHRRSDGKVRARHADALIAELASEQENVFSLCQLLLGGVSRDAIERRTRSGHIEVVHRRVYKLAGPALTQRGRWKAATLIHPKAVLSYRSGGALWQMRNSWNERIEVTIPGGRPQRPGLIIHRDALAPDEWCVEDGIPVTTPARTLLDLASVLHPFDLERCLHESEFHQHRSPTSIPTLLERHPRRRGSVALRAALESLSGGVRHTRSPLEDDFQRFVYDRDLPRPRTNVRIPVGNDFIEVDCLWMPQRVVAELDGRASHERAKTFESDRARDRSLQVLGFQVVRITKHALRTDPDSVERDLRALLSR
jgi:very-short-patch-repair endonuclease